MTLSEKRDEIVAAMRKSADDLWALAKEAKKSGAGMSSYGGEYQLKQQLLNAFLPLKDQSAALHARCVEIEHLELL